jgi:thymidylate synthase ThyX
MQATEELPAEARWHALKVWLSARDAAVAHVRSLGDLDVHKQIASRILEPFAHINTVVTATDFENFFALRCHPDAMPEIQVLAVKMARAYRGSTPRELDEGEWHLPFVDEGDLARVREMRRGVRTQADVPAILDVQERLAKLSVARCARVSYQTFDGKDPDPEADIRLHDRLLADGHFSPFEHQARACGCRIYSGNFSGWMQYRQTLARSVHESFDYTSLDALGDREFFEADITEEQP